MRAPTTREVWIKFVSNFESKLRKRTVNGTNAMLKPKLRAILSIKSIFSFLKKTKLQTKPGRKRMTMDAKIILSTLRTITA